MLYSRRNELGTVETAADGTLTYAGPNEDAVRGVVEYYAEIMGLTGDDLLRHVLLHVRGQTRAALVKDAIGAGAGRCRLI